MTSVDGRGPVSAALENDLRTWVRRHGVVIWLDLDDSYGDFADTLARDHAAGKLGYEVRGFRGSYLELMRALEDRTAGVEPPRLVVHLPGFNEDTVKQTPLYELYRAGVRYRKSLDTLVTEAATGKVKPDEIAAYREQGELTLAGADTWLRALLDQREGGLAAQLRALGPAALVDDLLSHGYVAGQLGVAAAEAALWHHAGTTLALPEGWYQRILSDRRDAAAAGPEDVAFAIASWALSVEYVDDLRRPPVAACLAGIDALPRGVRDTCRQLAAHLRDRHPEFYRRSADSTEAWLHEEEEIARAEDLGRIDTFRFEERLLLRAALAALAEGAWDTAAGYAEGRVVGASFWIRSDPSRGNAWQLVGAAAALGQRVALAGEALGARDHAEALATYVARGAAADRAHRELEQARFKLLSSQLPAFEALRARLDEVREHWRVWADAWAVELNRLCLREGFLPPAELQQRTLFEQIVRPQTQEGTTALFVVDALRFEMGEALHRALEPTAATSARLDARLAELPTNTEVGMNVLAPVARGGKLTASVAAGKFLGFSSGEFRVHDPDTRRRAMFDRVGGGTCPWLDLAEVLARDARQLKQTVAQARLLVVHSEEIDKAGEKDAGPAVFDAVMQQLRSAWRLLREAGVKRFVFTADHGFLLLDPGSTVAQAHGRKIDPQRRCVLSPVAADHTGEARVSLAELGYEGAEGHLMFPLGIAPFDTGNRKRSFFHGGNSLQERVIPVLTVVHRAASGGSTLGYRVRARAREGVAGMHCLQARVETVNRQGSLDFGGVKELELALAVPDTPEVSVELCQVRGAARLEGGALIATVGEEIELFFRLSGQTDLRVAVVLHHPSRAVDVEAGGPSERFAVSASGSPAPLAEAPAPSIGSWLEQLPEGVREVFAHIEAHGACVEDEATRKLGGARQLRRFSAKFESYAALAPFEARIEVVGGVKRYVKRRTGP